MYPCKKVVLPKGKEKPAIHILVYSISKVKKERLCGVLDGRYIVKFVSLHSQI